ncbi:hypothetical protein B0G80_2036 [Paraburkholderia sp. BL6669N2]|uniref:hypothetical protein n=1 Tax=Paraburkholderia sp. BL6669N2 TaxID=1938807 RepID=UPI000E23DBFB|nr:hypothetical protein [Paraburkholderia sp. BL6669N2]REG59301.1 hypothetical protein B0G80_2036 [Paraburkholderia sp. BL6669N2]
MDDLTKGGTRSSDDDDAKTREKLAEMRRHELEEVHQEQQLRQSLSGEEGPSRAISHESALGAVGEQTTLEAAASLVESDGNGSPNSAAPPAFFSDSASPAPDSASSSPSSAPTAPPFPSDQHASSLTSGTGLDDELSNLGALTSSQQKVPDEQGFRSDEVNGGNFFKPSDPRGGNSADTLDADTSSGTQAGLDKIDSNTSTPGSEETSTGATGSRGQLSASLSIHIARDNWTTKDSLGVDADTISPHMPTSA